MILEFLAEGAVECPLLRLYRWAEGEVALLREVAEQLARGTSESVKIQRLPFIQAIGDITFTWMATPADRGVLLPHDRRNFVMRLPPAEWATVAEIIRPFERSVIGFNWLLPVTEVQVLLSWSGQW